MKRILLIHLGLFFVLCLFAQQIVAPHYENFDTMVAGANQVPQNGWRSIARNTTFSTAVVNISNTTPYSTPNVARLYTNNNPDAEIYLISPEAVGLGSSKITFQARVAGTNAAALPNLIVGFMTEVNNPLTFEPVQVISTLNLSYQQFEVSFQGYDFDVEDRYYIAFKHGVSSATRAILIDNFAYEVLPVEPVFSCSPASKNFGSIDVGYQSTLQVFSISNTGVGALEISSVALTGADADQFTILSEPESYPVLISNIQSIEVTVRFNPDSIGQKNALLSISQGGTGATVHHIPLSGTGIIRPQGSTHLNPIIINTQSYSLQGTLNDYGNDYGSNWVSPSQIVLAGFDVVLQFTLEEDSFLSCDVQTSVGHGGVIIVNQIPSLASPAPVFIVASGDMGNSFTNRPLQAGTYYAIVSTYISNSMPVTFNFSFSFVPAGPAILSLTPQAYNYSYVPIGFSKQQNVQITNSGGGIIELETLQFLTSHPGSYTLVPPAESFPLQLAVGQTVGFSVTFAPTYEGMMEAEVRLPYCIVGNGGVRIPREEATIALMGFGHQLFAGGSGTQNDPYLISQPYHLNSIRYFLGENHRGKYYLQTTDLDFNIFPYNQGEGWEPIGDFFTDASYNAFTGIYNGNGYLIRNLYINRPATNHVGLFGVIEAATFKNVHLRNVNVTGQIRVGAMIGYCQYNLSITAIITQCSVETGTVSGIGFIGGLIGWTASTHLGRSHSNLNVSIIPNHIIYSDDVKLGYGGLVGANVTSSLVEFCYSFSTVYGFSCTGGLLGYQSTGTVKNSYARGNVTGLGNSVGGLVGGNLLVGNLERCYSTGLVTAQPGSMAGGLLGSQLNQSNTINSFWDMETSGMLSSGGSEIGKTTAEMTYPYVNTYVGWNFSSTWRDDSLGEYNDRYPILFWQLPVNPPQAPDAPSVTLSNSEGLLTLSWNSVTGATYYNIYASETPNPVSWGLPISATSGTSFVIQPSENRRFYMVKAVTLNP